MKPTPKPAPEILYEDNRLMVVYKPVGLLSHADKKLKEPDLLTVLNERFVKTQTEDLQIATRLDFNTDGLVVIAKGRANAEIVNKAVARNLIKKTYHAVVVGYMPKASDLLVSFLLKDGESGMVKISPEPIGDAKPIQTGYVVLDEQNGMSLLEIDLITGKTHQIRAHLASVGHALIGDPLYGHHNLNKRMNIKTQALSAVRIFFDIQAKSHPLHDLNGLVFERKNPWLTQILQQKR
ncbi:MAG: RNA pseudouridine synthase [Bacillus subtilis]|nr:RNA pseudouridine synthase [Bacillus subtilis]